MVNIPMKWTTSSGGMMQQQLRRLEETFSEMENEILHQVTDAIRRLEDQYQIAQTSFNALVAYRDQADAARAAYDVGTITLDLLLEAQRNLAQGEVDYLRALTYYQVAIAEVHLLTGNLVETCGYVFDDPQHTAVDLDAELDLVWD